MGATNGITEKYGLPDLTDPDGAIANFGFGFEFLFNNLRGIKQLSFDMRRDPGKVLAATEALDETFVIPRIERAKKQPKGTNMNYCFDCDPVMLAHTILSVKQFEKFYWPHFERMIDLAENYDKIFYIIPEGDSERFYDFFRELPKGHFVIHPEQLDLVKMKKVLPNITIAGGMPVDMLGTSTPEACVDYAKKLIDELAYDGGYIFSTNKVMSFRYDGKPKNYKAVCDFVSTYKTN